MHTNTKQRNTHGSRSSYHVHDENCICSHVHVGPKRGTEEAHAMFFRKTRKAERLRSEDDTRSRAIRQPAAAPQNLPHATLPLKALRPRPSVRSLAANPAELPVHARPFRSVWLAAWQHPTCPLPSTTIRDPGSVFAVCSNQKSNKPEAPPRLPSLPTPPAKRARGGTPPS